MNLVTVLISTKNIILREVVAVASFIVSYGVVIFGSFNCYDTNIYS